MQRDSEFSYQCLRCSRCCHHQAIQVNPYAILCLARHLGLGTGEFIERHTTNGGLFLRFTDEGACGFLSEQGCSVHPARPLVCRLYPLGREIDLQEGESYKLIERHRDCAASVGREGRLQQYLDQQGAGPFLQAADLYLEVVLEMQDILLRQPDGELGQMAFAENRQVNPWLDVDGILGQEQREEDPWRAMQRHQAALRKWIKSLQGEGIDER